MDNLSDFLNGPLSEEDIRRLRESLRSREGLQWSSGNLFYDQNVGDGNLTLGRIKKLGLGFSYENRDNTFSGGYMPGMLRFQYNRKF